MTQKEQVMRYLAKNLGKWIPGHELVRNASGKEHIIQDADTRAHELARAEYYDSPTRRYKVEHRKIGKYAEFRAISSEEKTNEQLRLESIKWFDSLPPKQKHMNIIEHPTKEEHGFEITKMTLLNLQVCSKLPHNEIEAAVNRFSPSGTTNGWHLETEGKLAPVDCSEGDGSKHYLFAC